MAKPQQRGRALRCEDARVDAEPALGDRLLPRRRLDQACALLRALPASQERLGVSFEKHLVDLGEPAKNEPRVAHSLAGDDLKDFTRDDLVAVVRM